MNDPKQSSRLGDDGWEAQRQADQAKAEAAIAAHNQRGREAVDGWDKVKPATAPSERGKQQ